MQQAYNISHLIGGEMKLNKVVSGVVGKVSKA